MGLSFLLTRAPGKADSTQGRICHSGNDCETSSMCGATCTFPTMTSRSINRTSRKSTSSSLYRLWATSWRTRAFYSWTRTKSWHPPCWNFRTWFRSIRFTFPKTWLRCLRYVSSFARKFHSIELHNRAITLILSHAGIETYPGLRYKWRDLLQPGHQYQDFVITERNYTSFHGRVRQVAL